MKTYVAVTGILFALLALAHAARVIDEGAQLLRQPLFVAFSFVAVALSLWAAWLLRHSTR